MSEASEETRVGIKAAFPVKKRELNGLNRVAAYLNDNRAERIPIVGYVEFTKHTDTIDGDELTVALVVVEPVVNAQGRSVKGYAEDVRRMIEDMRKSAGKPSVAETLFDAGARKELDDEIDGQIEFPIGGAPEKDAAELAAERAEGVPAADLDVDAAADRAKDGVVEASAAVAAADSEKDGRKDGETPGQKAFKADVVAAVTGTGRKARGATVRPTADPFNPTDPA